MPRNCTMHTHSWRGVTFHLKSQSQIIVALIIWVDDTVRPLIVDLLGYYSGDELFVVCEWSTPALKCAQNAANRLIIPFLLLLYYRLDFSSRICWKYSCSRFYFFSFSFSSVWWTICNGCESVPCRARYHDISDIDFTYIYFKDSLRCTHKYDAWCIVPCARIYTNQTEKNEKKSSTLLAPVFGRRHLVMRA